MKLPSYTVSKYFFISPVSVTQSASKLKKITEVSMLLFFTVFKLQFEVLIGIEIVRLAVQLLNWNDQGDPMHVPTWSTAW